MKSHPTYELLNEIGAGTSATVYRAYDQSLKRYVAIKELDEKHAQDERHMRQFWEEAQFLANLKHDNIVQIHGVDKERGWIIMELMEGSLDGKIAEGALPADLVRSVMQQTLEALEGLHEQDKLHGAIKPANLLINDQGRVKLSDSSGIALGDEIRRPTGSAKYMAPELLEPTFGEVTPALDLYCLGFTALELLMGPAFDSQFKGVGKNTIDPELAWMRWHRSATEKLPAASELVRGIPADLAQVIDKLLVKQVDERYGSAAEVLKDLEDRPIVLCEPPKATTAEPKEKRVAGAGVMAVGNAPPPPPPPQRAKSAPAPKPAKKKPKAKGKSSLNETLKKPYVLYPLLALILIPAIVIFLWEGEEPSPSQFAAIRVETDPPGATLYLMNKSAKNKTNADYNLPVGNHPLKLELKGYKTFEGKIEIKAENKKPFKYELEPLTPVAKNGKDKKIDGDKKKKNIIEPPKNVFETVAIETAPQKATVWINDAQQKNLTNGKFKMPVGKVRLKLVLDPTFHPIEKTVEVKKGGAGNPLTFAFDPILVSIPIKTNSSSARVFLDGKPLKPQSDGKFLAQLGKRKLKIVGGDGFGSLEQTIDVQKGKNFDFQLPLLQTRRFALLVGVSHSDPSLPDFLHADADVKLLAQTLLAGGYEKDRVTMMYAAQGDKNPDLQPTAAKILNALKKTAQACTPADDLVVALAGRQVRFKGEENDYFCPAEGKLDDKKTLVAMTEVLKTLGECKAKTKILLQDGWRLPAGKKNANPPVQLTRPKQQFPAGIVVLSACAPDNMSFDHHIRRNGLFFYFAARALQGAADSDKDRQVTLNELAAFTKGEVNDHALKHRHMKQEVNVASAADVNLLNVSDTLNHHNQGMAFLNSDDYGKALDAFTQAIKTDGNFRPSYLERAAALHGLAGKSKDDEARKKDLVEKALKDCLTVTKTDANHAEAWSHVGDLQRLLGRYGEALKSHTRAIELEPLYGNEYNARGLVFWDMGKTKLAVEDYSSALQHNPKLRFSLFNRGMAYRRQKEYPKAIDDFKKAIDLDPSNSLFVYHLALTQRQADDLDGAIENYNKAIMLNDQDPAYYYSRGYAYFLKADYKIAEDDFSAALKLNDKLLSAWYQRGLSLQKQSKYDDAIKDYTQAVQIEPKHHFAWNNRGVCHAAKKKYGDAIKDYSEAVKLQPKIIDYRMNRGKAYNDSKMYDMAIEDFMQVIKMNANYAPAYLFMSHAYRGKGDTQRAEEYLKKARNIDPNVDTM